MAQEAIVEIGRLERDLTDHGERHGRMLGRLVTVLGLLADGRGADRASESPIHPAVSAVIANLEASPAEPWRLDDLANSVNLDPANLGRLFRQYVGLTPLDYLARVRVERAAGLLADSALPAARVGAAVGWADPTYFARRFRALVGFTPTEYRRQAAQARSRDRGHRPPHSARKQVAPST